MDLLACPACHGPLRVRASLRGIPGGRIVRGTSRCASCKQEYPVIAGVPRFVPRENYASGFGLEWTKHARTQYDSYSGIPASEQRFFGQTGWPQDLDGRSDSRGRQRFGPVYRAGGAHRRNRGVARLQLCRRCQLRVKRFARQRAHRAGRRVRDAVSAGNLRPGVLLRHAPAHAESVARVRCVAPGIETRRVGVRRYLQGFVLAHDCSDQVLGASVYPAHESRPALCPRSALGGFHVAAGERHPASAEGLRHQLAAAGRGLQFSRPARPDAQGMVISRHLRHAAPRYDRPATKETFRQWAVQAESHGHRRVLFAAWRGAAGARTARRSAFARCAASSECRAIFPPIC